MQALPDKRPDTEFVMLQGAHAVACAFVEMGLVLVYMIHQLAARSRPWQVRTLALQSGRVREASKHGGEAPTVLVLAQLWRLIPPSAAWVQAWDTARMMTILWQLMTG